MASSSCSYEDFATSVKFKSRYLLEDTSQKFIEFILKTSEGRTFDLKKGTQLWRAQIGCKDAPGVPTPYSEKRMVPLKRTAYEGRLNPKGIPCLYLADLCDTSIAEVRPPLGSLVTVAAFEVARDLTLVDFTRRNLGSRGDLWLGLGHRPRPQQRAGYAWNQINRAMREPIENSDNVADYVPTQILAEHLRGHRFDGIRYSSRRHKKGNNIALFNMHDVKQLVRRVYKVESVDVRAIPLDLP